MRAPLYYRRKVLLGLLEAFDGELDKLKFQKLLFLMTIKQENPSFDFLPYQYGSFSFQAYSDLLTLVKYEKLTETPKTFLLNNNDSYLNSLNSIDRNNIEDIKSEFGEFSASELIRYTYIKYPWYAINSKIIEQNNLTLEEKRAIGKVRPIDMSTNLFTIGYEGKSLEKYLNLLLKNNVKALVDVRRNAYSMKYGFSKNTLSNACTNIGIEYKHLPDLGIASELRLSLKTQADYDALFLNYEKRITNQREDLEKVIFLIREFKRIALTCFEANVCQCHRGIVAKTLESLPDWKYPIIHLV